MMASRALIEVCPLGQFPCGNLSVCLPQVLQCNGHRDCKNGADEEHCGDNSGWADIFDRNFKKAEPQDLPNDCFLLQYPESCDCIKTEVECVDVNLHVVPVLSSNGFLNFFFFSFNFKSVFIIKRCLLCRFLSQNHITYLGPGVFRDLHKLDWLVLDHNPLKTITRDTFIGLRSLTFLSMVNTSLLWLPDSSLCQHMPLLRWLDFAENHVGLLNYSTLKTCTKLTVWLYMHMDYAYLTDVFVSPSFFFRDLSCNRISNLPKNTFRSLQYLQKLNISHNPSLHIHASHFDHLVQLESLSLEGIEIPDITTKMFLPMGNLSHIYFKDFQYCSYAPHVRKCKPNTDGISSVEDLLASMVLRVSVWVMAFITCFGNLFVIGMRSFIRAENNLHAACIKVLCFADCLMGVYLFFLGIFDVKFRGEYNRNALIWMDSAEFSPAPPSTWRPLEMQNTPQKCPCHDCLWQTWITNMGERASE
uniref:Relaxin family peptide receptor 2a n=1 Tax=Sinocyclocheilus rhinocerous TaxID=307959 RepID=A0A673L8E0_9TELE